MNRSRRRRTNALLLAALPLLLPVPSADATSPFRFTKVALEGETAPGTEPGTVFAPLDDSYLPTFPALDHSGAISFVAIVAGPAVTPSNRTGIWSWSAGTLARVVRAGEVAPERPAGSTFASFPLDFALVPPTAGGGKLAFGATVSGGGAGFANDEGMWVLGEGELRLIAGEGDPAPGLPAGVLLYAPALSVVDRTGHVLLACRLGGPGTNSENDEAFWSDRTGSLAALLREGDAAPGMPQGVVFGGAGQYVGTGYTFGSMAWSADSKLAIQASVTGPGVTTFDNEAVFVERAGVLTRLAREGDAAPGGGEFGGNTVIAQFGGLTVNRLEHAAFTARVGVNGTTTYGLWSTHTGALALVARPGLPAPGTADDFGYVTEGRLSDGGRIAFGASLADGGTPVRKGLWWDQAGSLAPVLLPGDGAPGRPGVTFESLVSILAFDAAGRLAFTAALEDPTSGARTALYQVDTSGEVDEVVATGEAFDVQGSSGPGSDLGEVAAVRFGGMDETGALAIHLDFHDGRFGIYRVSREGTTAVDLPVAGAALGIATAVPNPFAAETRLSFTLPRAAHVQLHVYDATGRRVRGLLDERRAAGPHSVEWNGRDDAGVRRAPGVYRVRVKAGDAVRSVGLVLLPQRR
jgi:hypothetical protein